VQNQGLYFHHEFGLLLCFLHLVAQVGGVLALLLQFVCYFYEGLVQLAHLVVESVQVGLQLLFLGLETQDGEFVAFDLFGQFR
jgi:hypothetical protein